MSPQGPVRASFSSFNSCHHCCMPSALVISNYSWSSPFPMSPPLYTWFLLCPFLAPFYRPFRTHFIFSEPSCPSSCAERGKFPLLWVYSNTFHIQGKWSFSTCLSSPLGTYLICSLKHFQDLGQRLEHNRSFIQVCGSNNTQMKKLCNTTHCLLYYIYIRFEKDNFLHVIFLLKSYISRFNIIC